MAGSASPEAAPYLFEVLRGSVARLLGLIELDVAEVVNESLVKVTQRSLEERPLAGPLLHDGHVQAENRGPLVGVIVHALFDQRVQLHQLLLSLDVAHRQVLPKQFPAFISPV